LDLLALDFGLAGRLALRLAGECVPMISTHTWGSPAFRPLPVRLAKDSALLEDA
jgi:hypothetical protein